MIGNRFFSQQAGDLMGGFYRSVIGGIIYNLFDEYPIDRKVIDSQPIEIILRSSRPAKSRERKPATKFPECTHQSLGISEMSDHRGLLQLETDLARRHFAVDELFDYIFHQVLVVERIAGEFDYVGAHVIELGLMYGHPAQYSFNGLAIQRLGFADKFRRQIGWQDEAKIFIRGSRKDGIVWKQRAIRFERCDALTIKR